MRSHLLRSTRLLTSYPTHRHKRKKSAAIAAAIASAASPVDTDSAPYPSMTAGPPPDTLESSSQRSFDVTSSAWGDTSYGGGNGGGSTSGRHGESNEVGPAEEASLAQDDEERRRLSSDEGEGSRGGAGAAQDFEAGWERRGEEGEAGRVSRFEVGDTPRLSMTPTYVGEAQDNGDRHGDGVALGSESRGSTEHVGAFRIRDAILFPRSRTCLNCPLAFVEVECTPLCRKEGWDACSWTGSSYVIIIYVDAGEIIRPCDTSWRYALLEGYGLQFLRALASTPSCVCA